MVPARHHNLGTQVTAEDIPAIDPISQHLPQATDNKAKPQPEIKINLISPKRQTPES